MVEAKPSKAKSDENSAMDKSSGRSAALNGLRDITDRTNEKANRQHATTLKGSVSTEQLTTLLQAPRDIDAKDAGDVQAVTEYVRDIYDFLREDEVTRRNRGTYTTHLITTSSVSLMCTQIKYMCGSYLESETRVISTGQRAGIVDWIVEVPNSMSPQIR